MSHRRLRALSGLLVLAALASCSVKRESPPLQRILRDLRRLAAQDQIRRGRVVAYDPSVSFPLVAGRRKNIVLISLDTLRADRLNCYGYRRRVTSPQIDRFAREAVVFENCFSASPGTLSSQMSLLTGFFPTTHGVSYRRYGQLVREKEKRNEAVSQDAFLRLPPIADDAFTLAEILKVHGYHTAGIHEGGYLSAPLGYSRGFDQFICSQAYALDPDAGKQEDGIKKTFFKSIAVLKSIRRPFFLFFHTYEIHSPYIHGGEAPPGNADGAHFSAAYDSGIAYTDNYVGHLLRWLKARRLWDDTVVVITSDHGEEFGDHYPIWYAGHGQSQYQEQNRVPLLVHAPGFGARRVAGNVQGVDVAPTLLSLALGRSYAERLLAHPELRRDGDSLFAVLAGSPVPERTVYFEDSYKGPERAGIVMQGFKLIAKQRTLRPLFPFPAGSAAALAVQRTPARELFFLPDDPGERNNLWPRHPERAQMMEKSLLSQQSRLLRMRKVGRRRGTEGSERSLQELKTLGYVQ